MITTVESSKLLKETSRAAFGFRTQVKRAGGRSNGTADEVTSMKRSTSELYPWKTGRERGILFLVWH